MESLPFSSSWVALSSSSSSSSCSSSPFVSLHSFTYQPDPCGVPPGTCSPVALFNNQEVIIMILIMITNINFATY